MRGDAIEIEWVACGVCGSDRGEPYATGKDYEYGTSSDLHRVTKCDRCANLYLNPRPVSASLPKIYPANYYAFHYDAAIHPWARRVKDFLDSRKIKRWQSLVGAMPRVLDIGCGNGRYLRLLHNAGVPKDQLFGIDMDERCITQLAAEGYPVFCGTFEEWSLANTGGSFDLILLMQSIEHVGYPGRLIRRLRASLADGGAVIIETPNTASLDAWLFRGGYWGGYHFPRHWNLLRPETIRFLVRENGMTLRECRYLPSQVFWIYSVHHWLSDGCGLPFLAKFFDPFRNIFLLALFTAFDLARAALGLSTSNMQAVATKGKPS